VKPLLTSYDFLLTPTLGLVPMAIEDVPPFLSKRYGRYIQFVLAGELRAHTCGVDSRGPARGIAVGVQLVGARGRSWSCSLWRSSFEAIPDFGFQRPGLPT